MQSLTNIHRDQEKQPSPYPIENFMLIEPSKKMKLLVQPQGEGAVADINQFKAWSGQRAARKKQNG